MSTSVLPAPPRGFARAFGWKRVLFTLIFSFLEHVTLDGPVDEPGRIEFVAVSAQGLIQWTHPRIARAIDAAVGEVRDIEAAFARLAEGTYGICMSCGNRIDPKRLDAQPAAIRCLECQHARETRDGEDHYHTL